jgi:GNAT superfamily N-acetyltransferase
MSNRPSWSWSTIQETWRWRGSFLLLLLGLREVFRPVVYWHVYYIFEIDLARQPVPEPYANVPVDVRIYARDGEVSRAKAEISSMGQLPLAEVDSRFNRGDNAAIAYSGGEPAGYAWLSFTSGVVELAFGVNWIVGPGEAIRYDNFVLPKWRGRRINSCLHSAMVSCARDHGITRSLASISMFNRQSMSLEKHYRKAADMKVTLVHVRGLNWTYGKAVGATFESRFVKPA